MGSDGTLGVRAIKERGGLVLAQDPASAKFDSMPKSIIDAGLAEIIAAAEKLPQRIIDTLHLQQPAKMAVSDVESVDQKSAFDKICILLRERTGHDFSFTRKPRFTAGSSAAWRFISSPGLATMSIICARTRKSLICSSRNS